MKIHKMIGCALSLALFSLSASQIDFPPALSYPTDKPAVNAPAPFIYADTATEFDALLKNNKEVVVQFFNPTCPVCMAFKRKGIFGKAAKALPQIKFAMTSSETGAALHQKYEIKAFPTFIFFKDGKPVGRYTGYVEAPIFIRKVRSMFEAGHTTDEPPLKKQKVN